jgi:hypothetical protein
MRDRSEATIRVSVRLPRSVPFASETMKALPDPADPQQAVILNVPFFADGLNFGDIVRIGEADDLSVHPVEAVVTPSGHVRFLLLLEDLPVEDLFEHLGLRFPPHLLRMEDGGDGLVAVSVHPDLDTDELIDVFLEWVADHAPDAPDLLDDTAFCITEPIPSRVGPLSSGLY